jgi:hypothetical protein
MKRAQFVKELTAAGCYLKRHGSRHDIYANPATVSRRLFRDIPRFGRVSAGSSVAS